MKIVKISEYKGLKLGKPQTAQATEEEYKSALDNFLNQNIVVEVKDGASVEGDTVNIDFEGFLDGKPFDGGKAEKYDLELGSHTFIPGFEEQLVGKKAGDEVDVNVTFPEKYQAENLKGKPVVFKCKVHAVQTKKLPTLDDEFVKKFGLETVKEFEEALKQNIFIQKSNKDLNDYLAKFWDKVSEESEIEFDDADLKDKMDQMIAYYSQSMAQYGATMDQYLEMVGQTMDQFKEQIKPEAVKTAKIDAIYAHICKEEGIEVTDEDVDTELKQMQAYYGLKDEDIEKMKKENLDQVKKDIAKTKVSTFLLKNND